MVYLIIFITVVVSAVGFCNRQLLQRLELIPWLVFRQRQWARVVTHGFVHADWPHLLVNMLVFWSFGNGIVQIFQLQQQAGAGMDANLRLILLYFGGLVAASIYDLIARRNNPRFASLGASGAVSAVVFATIFFAPLRNILIMGVLPIPGIAFGAIYLIYEAWSSRRTGDRINHHAHIFGALYGFLFPMITGANFEIFERALGLQIN